MQDSAQSGRLAYRAPRDGTTTHLCLSMEYVVAAMAAATDLQQIEVGGIL
jgi:hypothetical protein